LLTFSEPVDALFSTATVVAANGTLVSQKPILSADGLRMTVSVGSLVPSAYTVRWRVLSIVDGHTTSGFFLFGVIGQTTGATPVPQAVAPMEAQAAPPPAVQVVVRWINFAAALALAGAVYFQYFILRPGLARLNAEEASWIQIGAGRLLHTVAARSAGALLIGLIAEFLVTASTLLDTSVIGVWRSGMVWALLGGTKAGWSILLRAAGAFVLVLPVSASGRIFRAAMLIWFVILGAVAALLGGPVTLAGSVHLVSFMLVATVYGLIMVIAAMVVPKVADARVPDVPFVGPIAAAAVLAGITVSSHAIGNGPTAIVLDWIHLLAAALWVGGLPSLWLVLRTVPTEDRSVVARVFVPRFSRFAAIAVGTLGVSGAYSAVVHLPNLRALVATPYGRTLVVKLAFVLPLLALGMYNRVALRPKLEGGDPGGGTLPRFLRSVGTEVALGAMILLAVAALTITPPARVALPAAPQTTLAFVGLAGSVRMSLWISPGQLGWNRYEATAQDAVGGLPDVKEVSLRVIRLDADVPAESVPLRRSEGRFIGEGGQVGGPAWWEIDVVVVRDDGSTALTAFPLRLGIPPGRPSDPSAQRLLTQARDMASRVLSWREIEQITDGAGGVTVTDLHMARPDRVKYRTSSGTEAILIGATRYFRQQGGPWERDTLPSPIVLAGPYVSLLQDPAAVVAGRGERCDAEACQVVMWELASGSASFAAWIGLETFRIYRLYMIAPFHYMTSKVLDFNVPMRIAPP
jgi:putative copper export protein